MTSIWVAEHGWTYLNAIIDCCTREIVAWQLEPALPRRRSDRRRRTAAAALRIQPGELDARHRQRLGLHRPPLPRPPRRARDPPPPRRLPRPREPGLHRELVRETQTTGGLAERVRDPRRRPPRDRRLRRPLPPPPPLGARLPDTRRGRPDLGGSTGTPKTSGLTCQHRRGAGQSVRLHLTHVLPQRLGTAAPDQPRRARSDGPLEHHPRRTLQQLDRVLPLLGTRPPPAGRLAIKVSVKPGTAHPAHVGCERG